MLLPLQVYIKAIGEKSAEMVTDQGAIYVTSNRGYNWKAAVLETVSATLNRYISCLMFLIMLIYSNVCNSDKNVNVCQPRWLVVLCGLFS